jgi:hypothetical protein
VQSGSASRFAMSCGRISMKPADPSSPTSDGVHVHLERIMHNDGVDSKHRQEMESDIDIEQQMP